MFSSCSLSLNFSKLLYISPIITQTCNFSLRYVDYIIIFIDIVSSKVGNLIFLDQCRLLTIMFSSYTSTNSQLIEVARQAQGSPFSYVVNCWVYQEETADPLCCLCGPVNQRVTTLPEPREQLGCPRVSHVLLSYQHWTFVKGLQS